MLFPNSSNNNRNWPFTQLVARYVFSFQGETADWAMTYNFSLYLEVGFYLPRIENLTCDVKWIELQTAFISLSQSGINGVSELSDGRRGGYSNQILSGGILSSQQDIPRSRKCKYPVHTFQNQDFSSPTDFVSHVSSPCQVFGFVARDVASKISILRDLLGSDTEQYWTVRKMVEWEKGRLERNGCRTLLRLHRALGLPLSFICHTSVCLVTSSPLLCWSLGKFTPPICFRVCGKVSGGADWRYQGELEAGRLERLQVLLSYTCTRPTGP